MTAVDSADGQIAPGATNPPPQFAASTRAFAYAPRGHDEGVGPDGVDHEPVDLAEQLHEACKMRRDFPAAMLGPGGQQLVTTADSHLSLGRKALAHGGPSLALPAVGPLPVDLTALTHSRRSELPERCGPVSFDQLAQVLALACGPVPGRPGSRATPSAGAMYPLDVVVIAHDVTGLERRAYVYDSVAHRLLLRLDVDPDDFHRDVGASIAPFQPAVTLAVVATFARSRTKYGLRGYRFALLEAGHVVQAGLTAAVAVGLAALPWGGFIDAAADRHLDLDGLERSCVYLLGLSGPEAAA